MLKIQITDTGLNGEGPLYQSETLISNDIQLRLPDEVDYIIDSINDAIQYVQGMYDDIRKAESDGCE